MHEPEVTHRLVVTEELLSTVGERNQVLVSVVWKLASLFEGFHYFPDVS